MIGNVSEVVVEDAVSSKAALKEGRRLISKEQFLPLTSPYLIDGFRRDKFEIRSIEYRPRYIEVCYDVVDYYPGAGSEFHLSAVAAQILFQQAAIILIHLDNDLTEKTKEVYITENTMYFERLITSTEIVFRLEITATEMKRGNLFFSGDLSFNDGAFHGNATGIFPIGKCEEQA